MAARTPLPREVLRTHYGGLQKAIVAPLTLAGKLFSERLIGEETNSKVIDTDAPTINKATWILESARAALETSRQPDTVLETFCDVLDDCGEPALVDIAASMRASLAGKVQSDLQCNTDAVWVAFEDSMFSV